MDNKTGMKLLFVDDEYAIRERLKRTVDWIANNVELVGTAKSGNEAIELIDKYEPDIVLTDVKMLGMDGISLSKWINENRPHIRVIFLSAYNDFEYARKALKYDVVDYLLKPLDISLLFEIINRIRGDMARQRADKDEIERFKSFLEKDMPVLREKYVHDVLEGKYQGNMEELFKSYDIDLIGDSYVVVIITIESSHFKDVNNIGISITSELVKLELADFIRKQVKSPYKAYIFNENNESIGVVFAIDSQHQKTSIHRDIIGIMENTREYFAGKNRVLTIGLSNIYKNIKSLANCYYEALRALKARVYMGRDIIIPYNSLNTKESQFIMEIYETENIFEHMKNYDWFNVQLSIKRYFDHYAKKPDIIESHPQLIIYELISVLKRILVYNQDFSGTAINREEIDKLLRCETVQDMYEGIIKIFRKHFNLMIEQKNYNSNRIIKEVKEYINKNYMNNINLTEVAEYVYLSPSYLSRLFLKEAGVLFSDYLVHYRVEKAKELLLTTDLKVYEISEKVGYQCEKHLIKMFKRVVGNSPLEFKKNNGK